MKCHIKLESLPAKLAYIFLLALNRSFTGTHALREVGGLTYIQLVVFGVVVNPMLVCTVCMRYWLPGYASSFKIFFFAAPDPEG